MQKFTDFFQILDIYLQTYRNFKIQTKHWKQFFNVIYF